MSRETQVRCLLLLFPSLSHQGLSVLALAGLYRMLSAHDGCTSSGAALGNDIVQYAAAAAAAEAGVFPPSHRPIHQVASWSVGSRARPSSAWSDWIPQVVILGRFAGDTGPLIIVMTFPCMRGWESYPTWMWVEYDLAGLWMFRPYCIGHQTRTRLLSGSAIPM